MDNSAFQLRYFDKQQSELESMPSFCICQFELQHDLQQNLVLFGGNTGVLCSSKGIKGRVRDF